MAEGKDDGLGLVHAEQIKSLVNAFLDLREEYRTGSSQLSRDVRELKEEYLRNQVTCVRHGDQILGLQRQAGELRGEIKDLQAVVGIRTKGGLAGGLLMLALMARDALVSRLP